MENSSYLTRSLINPHALRSGSRNLLIKLVPTKGPVQIPVVDHAEKPSENQVVWLSHRMKPCGFRSGSRNRQASILPAQRASAERWPERAALSVVEGQPVPLPSPARMQLGHGDADGGLRLSMPGGTPKVARTSLMSTAFSSFASLIVGKNSASSLNA